MLGGPALLLIVGHDQKQLLNQLKVVV